MTFQPYIRKLHNVYNRHRNVVHIHKWSRNQAATSGQEYNYRLGCLCKVIKCLFCWFKWSLQKNTTLLSNLLFYSAVPAGLAFLLSSGIILFRYIHYIYNNIQVFIRYNKSLVKIIHKLRMSSAHFWVSEISLYLVR